MILKTDQLNGICESVLCVQMSKLLFRKLF